MDVNPAFARFCQQPSEVHRLTQIAEREEHRQRVARMRGEDPTAKAVTTTFTGLVNVDQRTDRDGNPCIVAQCPACAEHGGDSGGRHLWIHHTGAFSCVTVQAAESDLGQRHEHLSRVWQLAGGDISGLPKPAEPDPHLAAKQAAARAECDRLWGRVKDQYSMSLADWQRESADLPTTPRESFKVFASWWKPSDYVWCGTLYDKPGAEFRSHLFQINKKFDAAWEHVRALNLDVTKGYSFFDDSENREIDSLYQSRFMVVEHDGPADNRTPIEAQIALLRYCISELQMKPLGVVSTGGKGIHGIFDAAEEPPMTWNSVATLLRAFGADHMSWSQSNTRTPGACRRATKSNPQSGGQLQPVVWLPKN